MIFACKPKYQSNTNLLFPSYPKKTENLNDALQKLKLTADGTSDSIEGCLDCLLQALAHNSKWFTWFTFHRILLWSKMLPVPAVQYLNDFPWHNLSVQLHIFVLMPSIICQNRISNASIRFGFSYKKMLFSIGMGTDLTDLSPVLVPFLEWMEHAEKICLLFP